MIQLSSICLIYILVTSPIHSELLIMLPNTTETGLDIGGSHSFPYSVPFFSQV